MKRLLILAALALASCSEDPVAPKPDTTTYHIVAKLDKDTATLYGGHATHIMRIATEKPDGSAITLGGFTIRYTDPFTQKSVRVSAEGYAQMMFTLGNTGAPPQIHEVAFTVTRPQCDTAVVLGYVRKP